MTKNERDLALSLIGTDRSLEAWHHMLSELLLRSNRHIQPAPVDAENFYSVLPRVVDVLKQNGNSTRDAILATLSHDKEIKLQGEKLNSALDLGTQAAYMTETIMAEGRMAYHSPSGGHWTMRESFFGFMNATYHQAAEIRTLTLADQHMLRAWKLVKKLDIELKGTDNLADHLLYNRQRNTLYFFHHMGFLNAHLRGRAYDIPLDIGMETCLKMGTLPPLLLFETIHSVQSILFPSADTKGCKMMERLVGKQGLDPECNHYAGYKRKDLPFGADGTQYRYWGERLEIIQDLLRERPPTSKWDKWLQWQSSDANAFAIALLALVISIVVGIISIVLSAVQIWIAWMAWKHPA